jgi:hypothetical protein
VKPVFLFCRFKGIKMAAGKKCKRCGRCCEAIPCALGIFACGEHRPCKALETINGKKYCGLVRDPCKYFDVGEHAEWKVKFLKKMFSHMLDIGMGCCSCPENEFLFREMRRRLSSNAAIYRK